MNINQKLIPVSLMFILFCICLNIESQFLKSMFLDLSQNLNSVSEVDKQIKTINLDFETNKMITRPLTYEKLKTVLDKIYAHSPKNVVLMISPKELTDDSGEKSKIFNLFKTYSNLFLFSPYTNGPLGGFYQDAVFRNYANHFDMPFNKDVLFGARDSKIRRIILSFENKGIQPFVQKLKDMNYVIKDNSSYKHAFKLWDTTQIYQKSFKLGTFGQTNFSDLLSGANNSSDLNNKTVLVGSFDEFSIHISPSVFHFSSSLDKDNFKSYFFPINETAATVLNTFLTGKYVKFINGGVLLFLVFLFTVMLLVFLEKWRMRFKITTMLLLVPLIWILTLMTYWFSDYLVDISPTVLYLLILQYISLPVLFYQSLRLNEQNKSNIVNSSRIDALLLVSEKIAHDIRSPLSSVNLIIGSLNNISPEKKDLLMSAITRIDEIAQNILSKQKNSFADLFERFVILNIKEILKNLISEKLLLANNIKIESKYESDSLSILVNQVEFERVLSNILDNSLAAVSTVHLPKIEISVVASKDYVKIEIADNGIGISQNILSLIGKVRVTTKSENLKNEQSGSGIGLLHAKRVVEKMNGTFEIISTVGKGTIVILNFLAANESH